MAANRSRRTFLRGLGAAGLTAASTSLSGCVALLVGNGGGSGTNGGAPISFASLRNRITHQQADRMVSSRSQLIAAVDQPNTTIWIPGDATIDMTGKSRVTIANNVTIASNRNLGGKTGGLIRTTDQQNPGVFITKNADVHFRVTGVRLKGPRTDYFDPVTRGRSTYDYDVTGFRAYGKSVIVDHCEVFGWTGAGFVPGTRETPTQGWFHHNSMHHNQMNHLGYPMDLQNGQHLIEWNYFNHNRHSIAAFGHRQNAYEARFNVVGPNAIQHAFDMHTLGENMESLSPRSGRGRSGGKYVNVHHNVFELTSNSAFSIQGTPRQYARFCRNWCAAPKGGANRGDPEGVVYFPTGADVRVKQNQYGVAQSDLNKARQWLKRLAAQLGQRSNSLATHPSPAALGLTLDIHSSPALPNRTNASTNPTQQSTQTSMNTTAQSAATTTQTARTPQTPTPRTTGTEGR